MTQNLAGLYITEEELNDALRMASGLCRRSSGSVSEYEDLLSTAREAVFIAAGRFNRARGVTFITYAFPWITKHIRLERNQRRSPVKLPLNGSRRPPDCCDISEVADALIDQQQRDAAEALEVNEQIAAAFALMKPEQVALLREYYWNGKLIREIAKELNLAPTWTSTKLKKARDAFRQAWAAV